MDAFEIPAFLKIPAERRAAAWAQNPPKAPLSTTDAPQPSQPDPMREAQKSLARVRQTSRLTRLKERKHVETIPAEHRRWDPRLAKFVDERERTAQRMKAAAARLGITLEEKHMDQLTILPLNETGVLLERGKTVINADAPDWELQAKLRRTVKRVGRTCKCLTVNSTDGTEKERWTLDFENKTLHKDGTDIVIPMVDPDEVTTKETTDMAKKSSKAKVKKAPAAKKTNGSSKTGTVAALLSRASGTTTAEILKATGWPAVSVPAMAKAAGLKLRKEKEKGSPTRYYGS